jgi:hypothetical protein
MPGWIPGRCISISIWRWVRASNHNPENSPTGKRSHRGAGLGGQRENQRHTTDNLDSDGDRWSTPGHRRFRPWLLLLRGINDLAGNFLIVEGLFPRRSCVCRIAVKDPEQVSSAKQRWIFDSRAASQTGAALSAFMDKGVRDRAQTYRNTQSARPASTSACWICLLCRSFAIGSLLGDSQR